MAIVGLYKGFSTFHFQKTKNFLVTDMECVKRDLLNHIFTLQGTRVMMPTFGTIIPQLTFEPLDQDTIDTLQSELQRVFNYDPRVQLLQLNVSPDYDNNTVTATANLLYIELNMVDTLELNIQFEN